MSKKCILIILSLLFLTQCVYANDIPAGYDITKRGQIYLDDESGYSAARPGDWDNADYLYGNKNYPICGASPGEIFYLDKKSCRYDIKDGVAYISCIIYSAGGGAGPNGGPAEITPWILRYATYKANDRIIKILSCINDETGENITKFVYEYDRGFLRGLFWQVAKYLNINQYLD